MTDIIIVGAGTAGMTAALYALRSGKSVLVLENDCVGGQIARSPRVENFPTVAAASGSDLADRLFGQITEFGAEFELEDVQKVEKRGEGDFVVTTDYGSHECRAVILATGVRHKTVGVPREEEFVGKGVSYCAVCDGAFYKGGDVCLVGDANTALQYAILLSQYCRKVTICTWMDRFFGDKALSDAMLAKPNVEWIKDVNLVGFRGERELDGCEFERRADGSRFVLPVQACFVAIGQVPDNGRFAGLVRLDRDGYIAADESCAASEAGVFAAGDCRTKAVRQLTTAAADGAVAALGACAYIDRL